MRSRSVDFAVITAGPEIDSTLRERVLMRFHELPVCGEAYAQLAEGTHTLEELSRCPLISLGRSSYTYAFYRDLFLQKKLRFEPDIEAAITDQIPPMVARGLGIGFVPGFMLESLPKELHVRPRQLDEPIPPRHISRGQESGRTLSTAAMRLMHYLTKKEAAADERP